jgi:hypothetical protein
MPVAAREAAFVRKTKIQQGDRFNRACGISVATSIGFKNFRIHVSYSVSIQCLPLNIVNWVIIVFLVVAFTDEHDIIPKTAHARDSFRTCGQKRKRKMSRSRSANIYIEFMHVQNTRAIFSRAKTNRTN